MAIELERRPSFRVLRNRRRREGSRTNIVLQSEDLSTTWTNVRSVDTQAQGIAPDGTNTANKLTTNTDGGTGSSVIQQTLTTEPSTVYTASIYSKADQTDWMFFRFVGSGALALTAYYDLTNGVVGTASEDVSSTVMEDAGDGWYKCSMTFTSDVADTSATFMPALADANNDATVALDGSVSILLWGAQLSPDTHPIHYIRTTTSKYIG